MLLETKFIRKLVAILMILAITMAIVGCGEKQSAIGDKDRIAEERAAQRISTLNQFAISNSSVPLNEEIYDGFSLVIEDKLLVSEDKPIAFYGDITDIARKDNNYYIVADVGYYPTIKMILDCDKTIVDQAMKSYLEGSYDNEELYEDAILMATISSVSKVDLGINPDDDPDSSGIWLETDEAVFIARGKCHNILLNVGKQ